MPVAQQHAVSDRDGREDEQREDDRKESVGKSSEDVDEEEDDEQPFRPLGSQAFQEMLRFDHLCEPGHKLHRVWKKQGQTNGYITVPFAFPVRSLVREEKIVVCLVSLRRDDLQTLCSGWEDALPDLPLFDISSEVEVVGAEPLSSGAIDTILDKVLELPELCTEELLPLVQTTITELARLILVVQCACEGCAEVLQWRFACVDADASAEAEDDEDAGLADPDELDMRQQLRSILVLAGDGIEFIPQPFVSEGSKAPADLGISQQRWERLASEDWAKAVAKGDVDIATALKRMPVGWTALLKGDGWRGERGTGAVWRMPASGKRLLIEVDVIKRKKPQRPKLQVVSSAVKHFEEALTTKSWPVKIRPPPAATKQHSSTRSGDEFPESDILFADLDGSESVDDLNWLGPLEPAATAITGALQRSPPFRFGQDRRRDIRAWLKAMQQLDNQTVRSEQTKKVMASMKTGLVLDKLDKADIQEDEEVLEERIPLQPIDNDAPVVLLVGAWNATGREIFKQLHAKGYHIVVHRPWKDENTSEYRTMVQTENGAVVSINMARIRVYSTLPRVRYMDYVPENESIIPEDVFSLVAGVDKVIICACPKDETDSGYPTLKVTKPYVEEVLRSWHRYRQHYTDWINTFSPRVKLFDFHNDTDPDLWSLEGPNPSDVAYGRQRSDWFTTVGHKHPCMVFKVISQEASTQATLSSQKLNLNFSRFSALVADVYDRTGQYTHCSWMLRMEHFETTRIQYEFPITIGKKQRLSAYMPFNRFRPVRCDGVPLELENAEDIPPLDKSKVVQMGVVFRSRRPVRYIDKLQESRGDEIELCMFSVFACRSQPETQVVYVDDLPKKKRKDMEVQSPSSSSSASAETIEEEDDEDIDLDDLFSNPDDLDELFKSMGEDDAEAEARARAQAVAEAEAARGGGEESPEGANVLVAEEAETDKPQVPRKAIFNSNIYHDPVRAVQRTGFAFKIIYATEHENQEVPPKLKAKGYDFELARKEDVAERAVAALKDPMS